MEMLKEEKWKKFEEDIKGKIALNDENSERYSSLYKVALKLKETKEIATHRGVDLDNRSCIYVLNKWAEDVGIIDEEDIKRVEENHKKEIEDGSYKEERSGLEITRIPAGRTKEGVVNVDTGGHTGSKYDEETIIIDGDPKNGVKSAVASLSELVGKDYVPEQILECADTMPTRTSIFDTRSGLSLQKYTTTDKVFEMANEGLLTRELTDEELKKYNLVEAQKSQQDTINKAKEIIAENTHELSNGEKVTIVTTKVNAGSAVAYASGVNYYASIEEHGRGDVKDGITFAITCKPGCVLPQNIQDYGMELVEKYKDETGASGVFLNNTGTMLVAGGPKNPDFAVDMKPEELKETVTSLFDEYAIGDKDKGNNDEKSKKISQVNENLDALRENIKSIEKNDEKIQDSEELNKNIEKSIDESNKEK